MMIRFSHFVLVFLLIFSINGFAQNSPGLKIFSPASPNAASLGKYGETPVGLYNGTPNINIPLYTLKGRDLELPISLSYHAGGIKIDEIASWAGSGWSLNAGGVITRSVRGMPDDALGGYFGNYATTTTFAKKYLTNLNPTSTYGAGMGNARNDDILICQDLLANVRDMEPDIFYFNFGKYSGKFFMDENGQFVASPLEALKIEYVTGGLNDERITRWIVTTPDGIKYVFGNSLDGNQSAFENNTTTAMYTFATTAWYLVEIYSPNGDKISLTYSDVIYNYTIRSSEVLNLLVDNSGSGSPVPSRDIQWSTNYMRSPRLTSITSCNGTIAFGVGSDRTDLPGEAPLDNIKIFDNGDLANPLTKWVFYTDYLTNRLTLDSISQFSGNGSTQGQTYKFQYNGGLPDMSPNGTGMNAQDLWGYYNGALNSVLPQGLYVNTFGYGGVSIFGADRHADDHYMQMGNLTKITYPTGGYTQFDYEANQFYTTAGDPSIPTAGVGMGAGFHFLYNDTISQTFTITYPDPNSHMAAVSGTLRAMNNSCPFDGNGYSQCYYAWIEGVDGTDLPRDYFQEGVISLSLPAGTYKISAIGTATSGQQDNNFYFFLNWTEYPPPSGQSPYVMINKPVGGLRIKRITDFDGINTKIKRYEYNNFGDTISSGVMVNQPTGYSSLQTNISVTGICPNWSLAQQVYLQVKSYPVIPLIPTMGSSIGYRNVTELEGENGENGKIEYVYTTANDYPDDIKNYLPYPQPCSFDWRRGKILKKTVYKNIGSSFVPVSSVSNGYLFNITPKVAYGVSVEQNEHFVNDLTCGPLALDSSAYYVLAYRTIGEFTYLQSDTNTIYDQNDPSVFMQTINNYTYDTTKGHYQLLRTITKNSKKQEIETDYQYPQDLTLTGDYETARQNLVSHFILSPLLDQKTFVDHVQQTETNNFYKTFGNGLTLPESVDLKIGSNPSEKRLQFLKYDDYGNMVQQQKSNDVLNTYIWGYNNSYPIASVTNADSANIAFTSFEAGDEGGWSYTGSPVQDNSAITGSKYYTLTGSNDISKSGLSASKSFIISYWSKSGSATVNGVTASSSVVRNGWHYFEHKLSAGITSVTVSGSVIIDELRLFPSDAQMSSYTYSPLLGLTTSDDADNHISYYQYDALGRMNSVKDQDGNIIKTIQYHYAGQQMAP